MRDEAKSGGASRAERTVHVAVGLDDAYAMPLAAMVRSALDSLREGWRIELHVLDGGVSLRNRARLELSWEDGPVEVHWRAPDFARLKGLPIFPNWGQATYYRLLLPDHLPSDVDRVLYLDSDMIVARDLVALWEAPFEGALCLAVQDCTSPFFDPAGAPAAERAYPEEVRVRNWRALGLPPDSPYFNAGVLAVDVAAWRREGLSRTLLDCLHANREHVTYADQYALNVVCAGRWKPLDPRWNRPACLTTDLAGGCEDPLHSPEVWAALVADPWIVHYIGTVKAWHPAGPSDERERFFAALDRTEWAGWRPARTWGEWWDRRVKAAARLLPGGRRAA